MGILGILRDSAGSLGDSRGFSGFLEKVYEVSEVSNPSENSCLPFWVLFSRQTASKPQGGSPYKSCVTYVSSKQCLRL